MENINNMPFWWESLGFGGQDWAVWTEKQKHYKFVMPMR